MEPNSTSVEPLPQKYSGVSVSKHILKITNDYSKEIYNTKFNSKFDFYTQHDRATYIELIFNNNNIFIM